jgi:hypothetical protein
MAPTSPNVKIIQDLYTAFTTGDLAAFSANISPNIIWIEAKGFPTPGVFHSTEEIITNVLGTLLTAASLLWAWARIRERIGRQGKVLRRGRIMFGSWRAARL